ncbi:MAG TPA: DUF885 domain-containing protein [Deltaproteobacteria bacterium]|nr:DUF885 domain-containing protein [Deltaproteobacteria bacterium]HCP44767.1 DUF885 domain-containing protein [Deltaproteobacteria bacterium]
MRIYLWSFDVCRALSASWFAVAIGGLLSALLLSACTVRHAGPVGVDLEASVHELNPDAVAGVTDPALRQLLHDQWEATLRRWPTWASMLGDSRFDALLADTGPEAYEADQERRAGYLKRIAAFDRSEMSANDQLTLAMLESQLDSAREREVCAMERWAVSPWSNALTRINRIPEHRKVETPSDADNLVSRYQAVPGYVDGLLANLRLGLSEGRVANRESIRRILEMIDGELAEDVEQSVLLAPLEVVYAEWPSGALERFRDNLRAAVLEQVRPSVIRYRDFLEQEVLPAARPEGQGGIDSLPDGGRCYQAEISHFTTLPRTAETIHQQGLDELTKIHQEFRVLGEQLWGLADLGAVFERLRSDPDLYFSTSEEVQEAAEEALERARAAMPSYFGRLPQAPCIVRPIPDFEAPYSTIAYYRGPAPDGSKPGEYFVNTYAPETRPRHEAEVLAFHESIPGHHLQIAIAQELPEMPAFRRYQGMTAYVEGWALYTERLSDEMGLYSSDVGRLGMLSFDAWRASRLVVDTGLHAMGWSRDEAVRFMSANTPLAANNIDNEVDRYINWPGQALAYKTGQLEILDLRRLAEERLGARFQLSSFHDVVLSAGAISLPMLRRRVQDWIEETPGQ